MRLLLVVLALARARAFVPPAISARPSREAGGGVAPRLRDATRVSAAPLLPAVGVGVMFGAFAWINGRLSALDSAKLAREAAVDDLRKLKLELVTGGRGDDDAAAAHAASSRGDGDAAARVATAERKLADAEAAVDDAWSEPAVRLAFEGPLAARDAVSAALERSPAARALKAAAIASVVALLGWGGYVLSFDPVADALSTRGGYSAPLIPRDPQVAEARARIDDEYAAMLREYQEEQQAASVGSPLT